MKSRTNGPFSSRTLAKSTPRAVDNTDWLKTAAILFVSVDHFGYFFMEDDGWWSVFGRLAAPTFFFLLGYAKTRRVPRRWIGLGIILTMLDSSNNGWIWMAPNILLSFVLIRMARPHVEGLVQRHSWVAFIPLLSAMLAVMPIAAQTVEYGAEGWLWALFGLCQRRYSDGRSTADAGGGHQDPSPPARAMTENAGPMRLLACFIAAVVYVWQEQREYSFSATQFVVLILCVGVMSLGLFLFLRGPSRIQPREITAGALRFIGRHTLEIYAIELAGAELLVKLIDRIPP
jgi:hypothetical protein